LRKELSRVILAFARRIASALVVGFCFGAVFCPLTASIFGNTGVDTAQARSMGWVLIGPVAGLFLGMVDNSFLLNSFEREAKRA
jgi:hypothetical protein